jgi:polygalacturonase
MPPLQVARVVPVMLSLFAAVPAHAGSPLYNPVDFGAVGDGRTVNTAAFAKVMAACAAGGGGTVWVPAGKFLTGSIALVDNVALHLDPGAELLYSANPADSPIVPIRFEGTNAFGHAPLLYAEGRQNITITGRGTLNGQGWNWWWRSGRGTPPTGVDPAVARDAWRRVYDRIEAGEKTTRADFDVAAEFLRPSLVGLYHCKNVLVEGVTLFKSPMWMLHPVYSEDIVVRGVRFVSADSPDQPSTEGTGPNGDGIDVDSCRNVRISDCFFTTSDDCIVIKSGRDRDGLRTNWPTEYVTVTNCVMYQGHGAVVIGSETAGGIRNLAASNIVAQGTDTGIRIKSQRGRGGVLEHFRFDNWVIADVQKTAFEITMRYGRTADAPASERTPRFRDFSYSNITVVNAKKVATIEGLPERAVEQLRFADIDASGTAGFIADHAAGIELHHVRIAAHTGSAIRFDQSHNLTLDDVGASTADAAAAAIALVDTADAMIAHNRAAVGAPVFLRVSGAKSAKLRLTGNDLSAATTGVVLADGAPASAVLRD